MTASISYPEAAKALAEALATGEAATEGAYYLTAREPEERDGMVVYWTGYAAADPAESDEDGDPTGFIRTPGGDVTCVGPIF